jgi:hypothetical protein
LPQTIWDKSEKLGKLEERWAFLKGVRLGKTEDRFGRPLCEYIQEFACLFSQLDGLLGETGKEVLTLRISNKVLRWKGWGQSVRKIQQDSCVMKIASYRLCVYSTNLIGPFGESQNPQKQYPLIAVWMLPESLISANC